MPKLTRALNKEYNDLLWCKVQQPEHFDVEDAIRFYEISVQAGDLPKNALGLKLSLTEEEVDRVFATMLDKLNVYETENTSRVDVPPPEFSSDIQTALSECWTAHPYI